MSIAWSGQALHDLEGIWEYVARDDPAAATLLAERIDAAAETIASLPGSGRVGRIPGTREHAVARTRYVVIYRVVGRDLQILRVLHGAQDWPPP